MNRLPGLEMRDRMSYIVILAHDSNAICEIQLTACSKALGALRNSRTCRTQAGGKHLRLKVGMFQSADKSSA